MKFSKIVLGTTLLSSMALGTPAFGNSSDKPDQPDMSMMGSGQGGSVVRSEQQGQMAMSSSQSNMSDPMMQMMMQMMQMMMQQHGNKTSMHGGHHGAMDMMTSGRGDMSKMGMMKEKRAQMKQHMQTMESTLGNIESLLQELVDLQKTI